jgi:hypothetical protein
MRDAAALAGLTHRLSGMRELHTFRKKALGRQFFLSSGRG